jgi:hypothetical protein
MGRGIIMKRKKTGNLNSQIDVEKMNVAYHFISKGFPVVIKNTYVRGKTAFRDFLYEKMGCSLLKAEILVDALERQRKITFRRLRKGMRFGIWEIHSEP